jgi:hypothetical protein
VVVLHPYLGAEQEVTDPQDQFQACNPPAVVSAGEFEFKAPLAQAVPDGAGPFGLVSCGVLPLPEPQVSTFVLVHCA